MRKLCYMGLCVGIMLALSPTANAQVVHECIEGSVDFEDLFIAAFTPGTGDGISIASDGTNVGAPNGTAFTNVDLDGDGIDDIRVDMNYSLHQSGDSRIGFRQNTAGTAITMFSDSNTGTDYDYGFLNLGWEVSVIAPNGTNGFPYTVATTPTITTSSLNGETELYEFGILDTTGAVSAAALASYNAQDYDGGDGTFSGGLNSLGDAAEILIPEHLGALGGVVYDAEATITGDLANNPTTLGDATDNITVTSTSTQLWYGGFDVGTDTNVGSPSGSLNWTTDVKLITAVPEPGTFGVLALLSTAGLFYRRRS